MFFRRSLFSLVGCAALLAACSGAATPFPTAGITVQAFPHVEISTATLAYPAGQANTSAPPSGEPPPPSATPPPPPTETPLPTDTLPPPTDTATATALIQLAPPTATVGFVRLTQPKTTKAAPPTATQPAPASPIRFRAVQPVSAQHDPARPPNGSITTLSVEFTGSRPPFALKHDNLVGSYNSNGDGKFDDSGVIYTFIYFAVAKTCGGVIVGAITVTGGDGQSFTHDYYIANAPACS